MTTRSTARSVAAVGVLLLLVAVLNAPRPSLGAHQPDSARIQAITQPSRDLELAFNISGRVMDTLVEPGDRVSAGDPLIQLDDREARIRLNLHRLRSESTAAIDAASATLDLQIEELAAIREAFEADGVNEREVARRRLEVERARASVFIEELKRQEAALEFEAAAVQLEKYTLNAPIDGFVEIVLPRSGETVEALAPVLRLVSTDPLEIRAAVPASRAVGLAPGSEVWVALDLDGLGKFRSATVRSLSQVADGATSTRMVRIALPNPDGLPAGILCEVRLDKPAESSLAQTE